jgi:hypothetical protein
MKTAKDLYYFGANECISGMCRRYCKGTDSVACCMVRLANDMILKGKYYG